MIRRAFMIGALAAAAAFIPVQDARAQVGFGAQGSYDFAGDGAFGLGARANVGLGAMPVGLQGTFDYFFGDEVDYWQIGANVIYSFMPMDVGVSPYVGGGLNYLNVSDVDFDDTGWQVLGGVDFGLAGMLSPFAELKYVDHVDGEFQISVGVNF